MSNVNNKPGLVKVTDFTEALNRLICTASGGTVDGYIIISEFFQAITNYVDAVVYPFQFAASQLLTDLVASGSDITASVRAPEDFTIDSTANRIMAAVNVAPTGSSIIVDILKNGTSIFSTTISIDATEKTSLTAATPYVLTSSSISFTKGDEITTLITQVGATVAGQSLTISIDYIKA